MECSAKTNEGLKAVLYVPSCIIVVFALMLFAVTKQLRQYFSKKERRDVLYNNLLTFRTLWEFCFYMYTGFAGQGYCKFQCCQAWYYYFFA